MKPKIFSTPSSWIEGDAVRQLEQVASLPGVVNACGMPDLHVSKGTAVGSVVLTRGHVYPHLVGNDVGCGYTLFQTTISNEKLNLEKMASKLRGLDEEYEDAHKFLQGFLTNFDHVAGLGTVGGGNHFAEFQKVSQITDTERFSVSGVLPDRLVLLIHSGSRSLGEIIWRKYAAICGAKGFTEEQPEYKEYLNAHNQAVTWASANRMLLAKRILDLLDSGSQMLLDLPHNFISCFDGGLLHRKGAAPANCRFSPLPGSRGTHTYLLAPTDPDSGLASLAHGAGRKISRSNMHGRTNVRTKDLRVTPFGGLVVCGDDILLEEEHHTAYKSVDQVLADLKAHNLADSVATFQPVLTYKSSPKSTRETSDAKRKDNWKAQRHQELRRRK
jgi:release factor H-coupled RctB family protein